MSALATSSTFSLTALGVLQGNHKCLSKFALSISVSRLNWNIQYQVVKYAKRDVKVMYLKEAMTIMYNVFMWSWYKDSQPDICHRDAAVYWP